MTTRRRVATFTFSPDDGDVRGSTNRATDLERKLELLEARFTMPLHFPPPPNHQTHSSLLNNSNNSNSPATLDPENSSPASIQSSTIHPLNQNHNSHQSFGFDTPSLWSTNQQSSNHLRISGNAHTAATKVDESTTLRRGMASPSRSATVEATTKRLHSKSKHATNEEHSWQDIAAAHIARIQQEQLHLHNDNDSQQCTLLTSHVNNPSDDATTPIRTTTTKITMDAPLIPDATARKALTSTLQESTPPLVTSPDIKKVRDSDVELVRLFNSFRFSRSTSCSMITLNYAIDFLSLTPRLKSFRNQQKTSVNVLFQ
jgi:hypothetical protein